MNTSEYETETDNESETVEYLVEEITEQFEINEYVPEEMDIESSPISPQPQPTSTQSTPAQPQIRSSSRRNKGVHKYDTDKFFNFDNLDESQTQTQSQTISQTQSLKRKLPFEICEKPNKMRKIEKVSKKRKPPNEL